MDNKVTRKKNKILNVIGIVFIVIGIFLIVQKKEYYFHEYGFDCENVCNVVDSSFALAEETTVNFNFYKKGKGEMTVCVKDSSGNIVFFSDKDEFKEKYSKKLAAGTYYYNIEYSDVSGDFELYAVRRSVFGFEY